MLAGSHRLSPMTAKQILNRNSVIRRRPDVVAANVDQDVVMVSIESGYYYGVSDVARQIWQALEQPIKIADLIDELAVTYKVDRATCAEQTMSFLEDLLNEQLIRVEHE